MFRVIRKLLGSKESKALGKTEKAIKRVTKEPKNKRKQKKSSNNDIIKSYKVQKREQASKKGALHKNTEKEYNEEFGGCPSCSRDGLTIQWIIVSRKKKAKSIECEYCNSLFEEKVVSSSSGNKLVLNNVKSLDDLTSVKSATRYEMKKYMKLRS